MKLYLLKRTDEWGYDEYDSLVYAAESAQDAVDMSLKDDMYDDWTTQNYIDITFLGFAESNITRGKIIGSFNAG